jgi:endonuclease/exonuclease/phosphatase family metal-dependent hydrolase
MRGPIFLILLLVAAGTCSAKDIVFAAYNLRNCLKMERRVDGRLVPDAPKPEAEMAAAVGVIRAIAPDILGLIEMGDEAVLREFQERLKSAGVDLPHAEWVRGEDPVRHIALLSRFPLTARDSRDDVPFEHNGSRLRVSRGILDVTVSPAGVGPIRIVGAHLKSRRTTPDFDERTVRAKEALALRGHLDSIFSAAPDSRLILFGDLNDTKNEYPVRVLLGTPGSPGALRDLPLADSRGFRWTHYWAEADQYSRIDYIFVSARLRPLVAAGRSGISDAKDWAAASDHRAIHMTIRPDKK